MTDLTTLRKNICAYRKLLNITQEELSYKLGGSKNLVSNYENGISTPDILTLIKLPIYLILPSTHLWAENKCYENIQIR